LIVGVIAQWAASTFWGRICVGIKSATKYKIGLLIIVLIVLGKTSGLLKDVLITYYHGVSLVTDAFFIAASISSLLYAAIYSSISVLVIPLYSRLRANDLRVESDKVLSSVLSFYFLISVGFAVFTFQTAPELVDLFANAMSSDTRELAVDYLSIMSVTFILSPVVGFYNAVQVVNKSVVPTYLAPIVNNVVFSMGLVLFSSAIDFYKVLILGVLAWLVLIFVNYYKVRWSYSYRRPSYFNLINNKVFLIVMPAILSFYIEQANNFVAIYFSTRLETGSVSILSYANKLNLVLLSVFVVILTTLIFPKIADDVTKGKKDELSQSILNYLRPIIVLGFPVVFLMSFYSKNIVSLLFQRGSFDGEDVIKVSAVFGVAVLGLVLSLIRDVMNRVYFAHEDSLTPMVLSLLSLFVNAILCFQWYQDYALVGLVFAGAVSILFNCFMLLLLGQRRLECNLILPLLNKVFFCSIGLLLAGSLLSWANAFYPAYWIFTSMLFLFVYFVLLYCFRVKEVLFVCDYMGNQLRRFKR